MHTTTPIHTVMHPQIHTHTYTHNLTNILTDKYTHNTHTHFTSIPQTQSPQAHVFTHSNRWLHPLNVERERLSRQHLIQSHTSFRNITWLIPPPWSTITPTVTQHCSQRSTGGKDFCLLAGNHPKKTQPVILESMIIWHCHAYSSFKQPEHS